MEGFAIIDLELLVSKAHDLEPLPASVTRLSALIADDNTDAKDIVEVLQFDPALTAGLLRSANSAAVASRKSVSDVKDAVLRMGFGSVLALAVAASVRKRMVTAVPEYGLSENALWRHCVLSSLAVEAIQAHSKTPITPDAFTAALLHDIGKLVLARFLSPELLTLMKRAHEEGRLDTPAAESELLGVNHGEVGALMAQGWKLPERIVHGIGYHHNPADCEERICYVVALANVIAHHIDDIAAAKSRPTQESAAKAAQAAPQEYLDQLTLNPESYVKICETATRRMDEVLRRYQM